MTIENISLKDYFELTNQSVNEFPADTNDGTFGERYCAAFDGLAERIVDAVSALKRAGRIVSIEPGSDMIIEMPNNTVKLVCIHVEDSSFLDPTCLVAIQEVLLDSPDWCVEVHDDRLEGNGGIFIMPDRTVQWELDAQERQEFEKDDYWEKFGI